ncbi:MAG: hypothetical protein GF344_12675 [Chitinivibrionales bacterium]|nr:hypothetical protein [Chitinivibrionales bacterium]
MITPLKPQSAVFLLRLCTVTALIVSSFAQWTPIARAGFNLSIFDLVSLATIVLFLLDLVRTMRFSFTRLNQTYCLFVILWVVSVFVSSAYAQSVAFFVRCLIVIGSVIAISFWVSRNYITIDDLRRGVLIGGVSFAVYVILFIDTEAFLILLSKDGFYRARRAVKHVPSAIDDLNRTGFYIVLAMSVVSAELTRGNGIRKAIYAICLSIMTMGAVMTLSRTNIALALLVLSLTFVQFARVYKKWAFLSISLGMVPLACLFAKAHASIIAFVFLPLQTISLNDPSLLARQTALKAMVQFILDHPWGLGLGTMNHYLANIHPVDAHNSFINYTMELGVVSSTAFFGLYLISFYRNRRSFLVSFKVNSILALVFFFQIFLKYIHMSSFFLYFVPLLFYYAEYRRSPSQKL